MIISKKPRYNLNLIVQETGLKADTIRAWERRYGLPQPSRTAGGHRLYSDYDLQMLNWLSQRQKDGMRISQAAINLQELIEAGEDPFQPPIKTDLPAIMAQDPGARDSLEKLKDQWLAYCYQFEEAKAEQILSQAFAQFPVHAVCTDLILPGLRKVGEEWYAGKITIQQEHFTSEIAGRKLQSLISTAPNAVHSQRVLIGCPPGEQHTILPLMMTLLLKNRGWQTIYLGANVPLIELQNTVDELGVDLVILSANRLITSAALFDTINQLAGSGIPVAFSGWIFNQVEGLINQFPALYLGNDLGAAVNSAEDFLLNPTNLSLNNPLENPYPELIQKFDNIIPQLNQIILTESEKRGLSLPATNILNANADLTGDILAALSLGNIDYLIPNLVWTYNLLGKRNLNGNTFETYISVYLFGIEEILGNSAKPIIDLLKNLDGVNPVK